jgi:hypothetical protein
MVEDNEANRKLLIEKGLIEKPQRKKRKKVNVIDTKNDNKHSDSDTKRESNDEPTV